MPGYQVSALHRIGTADPTHSAAAVLDWRARLAAKYRGQLGESLSWDEEDPFEQTEVQSHAAGLLFRYVAAILDQQGSVAARSLIKSRPPAGAAMDAVFAEASRLGFAGRFPQILLHVQNWLPFERNLIMEEPSWRGDVERSGSLPRLRDEVQEVRAFISGADRKAAGAVAAGEAGPDDVLAAAWQGSEPVWQLSRVGLAKRLPLSRIG